MFTENEIETRFTREQLAEDVRQALVEEMRKAVAAQKWEQLASIILLLQGSQGAGKVAC
jgi:hypothetical protein